MGQKNFGLGLKIFPTGKKSFVLSYRFEGRKRLSTLGKVEVISLLRARELARNELVKVDKGIDPIEEKQKSSKQKTIKQLCEEYMERHAKVKKKSWKDDERYFNKHVLPVWGSRRVSSIKRSDVAILHSKIGKKTPYAANRTIEVLSKMFKLAIVCVLGTLIT